MLRNADFWAGLVFLLLGAAIVMVLIPLGVDEPRKVKYASLSPAYYPRLIGIAMAMIGAAITLRAVRNADAREAVDGADKGNGAKIVAVFIILAAVAVLLPWAGFVLTCTGALVLLMILGGERNPLIVLGIAAVVPLLLHLFFGKIANIPIPGGILDPYLRAI